MAFADTMFFYRLSLRLSFFFVSFFNYFLFCTTNCGDEWIRGRVQFWDLNLQLPFGLMLT